MSNVPLVPFRSFAGVCVALRLLQTNLIVIHSVIQPSDVMTSPFPGSKIVYLGDTCDPSGIAEEAMNCDVLVHEVRLKQLNVVQLHWSLSSKLADQPQAHGILVHLGYVTISLTDRIVR